MTYKSFACAIYVVLLILTACTKNNIQFQAKNSPEHSLDSNAASLGDCTTRSALPYICFDSVLMDSRCPSGVECVWQGTSVIKVSFHEAAGMHTFDMSLKGFPRLIYNSDTTINGYTITFTDLKPYPAPGGPSSESPTAYFTISH